jgi:hypothetical protein
MKKDSDSPRAALDPTLKQDKEQALFEYSRLCSTYNILAAETLQFFEFYSGQCAQDFMKEEHALAGRIAQLLNYFAYYLLGPKQLSLKVKSAAKLHWNPKLFLTNIARIYCHFSEYLEFVDQVVADQRSFQLKLFENMLHILQREHLVPEVP